MNSHATSSRVRAPNFTREEQDLLCNVLEPYLHIIESKKTDNIKQIQKGEAWRKIALDYNANTKNASRTVENLIGCYRNLKSKIKKQHSEAKMKLTDPTEKFEFINALEANGEDWGAVSRAVKKPVDVCKVEFKDLKKEYTKFEAKYKKKILGTGGGPPPHDEDNSLSAIKNILVPQVDGLFTIYDGDAELMHAFQESLPENKRISPIESVQLEEIPGEQKILACEIIPPNSPIADAPVRSNARLNRQDILKKRLDAALIQKKDSALDKNTKTTKKSCNDTFQTLAEAKTELVRLQSELVAMDIAHKKTVQALEVEEICKQYKYQEEMRQKELKLMDLKIMKMSE